MKILLGITYYYPNISGVSIYAKRLAEGLVKNGHKVTVLTSQYNTSLLKEEEINGVKIVRCPVNLKIGKGVFMFFLPFIIFGLAKNASVINCHLPQFESFIFSIIGKLLGKKVILTHHTDLSGWKGIFNQISEGTVWFGQIIAGIFADKIVPYTKDYADHSWYLQLFRNKLEYILPPIIVSPVHKAVKEEMKKKIGQTKYIVGFAGRIAKQKGIPYLLNSIPFLEKDLIDFKIVFAGPYENVIGEKYFEEIDGLVNKYRKFLVFLGTISEENMSDFYSICDVLVLPSDDRLESFGLVQAEAMMNGCPVVATNLPGARVPIKLTNMGEIARIANSENLSDKIFLILKNRKKYVKSQSEIQKIFNIDKTVETYGRLFN